MKRIALATGAKLPTLNEDDLLLVPPLRELGVTAVPAVWDSPDVCWEEFQGVVWGLDVSVGMGLIYGIRIAIVVAFIIFGWHEISMLLRRPAPNFLPAPFRAPPHPVPNRSSSCFPGRRMPSHRHPRRGVAWWWDHCPIKIAHAARRRWTAHADGPLERRPSIAGARS